MSIERLHCGPRMSQVVIHDNKTVYLAGQVATHAEGKNVAAQTQEILALIDALLGEAKTDKSKLLSATIWLTDMATFDEMNSVWERWVAPGTAPARATVLSPALAGSAYKIEIGVIAARD
jgi:enamine deaminase RidA (YjgF/YER057c/UK114 family)